MQATLLFLLLGTAAPAWAPAATDSLSVADVKATYARMFTISVHDGRFVSTGVNPVAGTHPLAGFVESTQYMIEYLLEHGRSFELDELKPFMTDSAALSREFHTRLADDPVFDGYVLPLVDAWLQRETGTRLAGLDRRAPRKVGLGRAMLVGSRYFYLSGTRADRYVGHICTGINGFREFPGERDIMLEAFVFSAIIHDLMTPRYHVSDHFGDLLGEARDARITADVDDAAAFMPYARTVIWERMTHSPQLQNVLLHEYDRVRELIPLRLDL